MLVVILLGIGLRAASSEAQTAVYVGNHDSATVSVIDTTTQTVIATIPVGNTPYFIAVTPDGSHVYVTNELSATVSVIATVTQTVSATIPVGNSPLFVAVTPDGSHVYVVDHGSATVSVIATATQTVTATIPVGSGPYKVAVAEIPSPQAPMANAGPDQTVRVGTPVTLDGTASSDPGGLPLTYAWTIVWAPAGSTASLTTPTASIASFTPDLAGDYGLQLIVTNSLGLASAPDPVTITATHFADPMAEDYSAHVIPFYKIDAHWFAFLVVADTSHQDMNASGSPIALTFYDATCNLVSDAVLRITAADAQLLALHDPTAADGQFHGIPGEGVILLDGRGVQGSSPSHRRFLTYVLLINTNNNSMIRMDSIPCQGPQNTSGVRQPCERGAGNGTWLRYDTFNTVAATFGDTGIFRTNLYFFSARGNLEAELQRYGQPRHLDWASSIHVDGWCNEIYLGSRRLDLACTKRVSLSSLNYTRLNMFPATNCSGAPGHLETWASDNGTDPVVEDYSGFQETIAELVRGVNMIGTGYMHHSGPAAAAPFSQ